MFMKQRVITAVIAMLIFLPMVIVGGVPYLLLMYIMASIALFELLRMRKISLISLPGVFSLLLLWVILFPAEYIHNFSGLAGAGKIQLLILGVLVFLSLTVISKNQFTFDDIGFCFLAIIYIGIGFYFMMVIRHFGLLYFFFVLLLIWATDSGAYFCGSAFGKRKLMPAISPNKTVEGAIGGILSAMIVAILFYFFTELQNRFPLPVLLIISVILSIFGQVGDLVESALKRYYGVKDSGKLLPGHGGILDRVDSWLFVFPVLYFFLFF